MAWRWFSGVIARAKLRAAPATWVWISTPPGKTNMPVASIVRPPSTSGDDPAVRDADVLDHAVDAVGGVVDFPARDPQHGVSVGSWLSRSFAAFAKLVGHPGFRGGYPRRLGRNRLVDAADDLFVGRIRRLRAPAAAAAGSHPCGRRCPGR